MANDKPTPAQVLQNSGWTEEDLAALPAWAQEGLTEDSAE